MSYRLFENAVHSSFYAKFRPQPPRTLVETIVEFLAEKRVRNAQSGRFVAAADVGCGSGQCTSLLADHFDKVHGFDISKEQTSQASEANQQSNVDYKVSPAETLPLADSSIDLITCAQSFHWFNFDKFYLEAKRVLKPNGVLALITYEIPYVYLPENSEVISSVHGIIRRAYFHDVLRNHWAAVERQLVDTGYKGVEIPFADVQRRVDSVKTADASGDDVLGYVKTWSAYNQCLREEPERAKELDQLVKEEVAAANELTTVPDKFTLEYCFSLLMGRNT